MATPRSPCIWATRAGTSAWSCVPGSQHSAQRNGILLRAAVPPHRTSAPGEAVRVAPSRACGGTTAASTAHGCCLPRRRAGSAGPHWGARSITSPSGTRANRTRPPGWSRPRPPAPSKVRPGKRVAAAGSEIERAWRKEKRTLRLVVRVTERTIDKKGQHLLVPDIELEGWWTSLTVSAAQVIELYKHHGMHEQFHSELQDRPGPGAAAFGQVRHQRCVCCIWRPSPTTACAWWGNWG
jgi:hypothetical protein